MKPWVKADMQGLHWLKKNDPIQSQLRPMIPNDTLNIFRLKEKRLAYSDEIH